MCCMYVIVSRALDKWTSRVVTEVVRADEGASGAILLASCPIDAHDDDVTE